MSRVYQVIDGEGFTMPAGEIWRLICCDCGLTHDIVIVGGRKKLDIAMRRNKRATTARRKKLRAVLNGEAK